ncbi:integrase catalytic domain-containing protein [Sphingomonas faeni]|uniref:integrase catalytic domain-containing protein n=1 Tax=Sphingomonas faeni TaxID=185950 RepID=UPI002787C488|nr:transposase family protein [Sphingomonas faeni]MDQ0839193.1 putative transposase [Sphingomonas faeni]
MAKNNLENLIVEIDGAVHAYGGHLMGRLQLTNALTGAPFVAPQADGTVQLIDDVQFDRLLDEGRVKIRSKPSSDPTRRFNDAAQWTLDQAAEIDPAAPKRLAQLEMLDAAGVLNGSKAIDQFMAASWGEAQIAKWGPYDNPHTLRRWRAKRGKAGRRHARQMIRMNGRVPRGPYGAGVPAEVAQKHAYDHWVTKARVKDTYSNYVAEMTLINEGAHQHYARPDAPYMIASEETIRRRCNALERAESDAVKRGTKALEQDWMGGGRPLTASFAMQRVIIDHTRLDVHVRDETREIVLGRPWLTLAIDVATRAVVAYLITFVDPSAWTVGEILRRMALPKRPPADLATRYPILAQIRGKPHEVIVDNATEFRSHTMEAAARAAGFGVRYCPVGRPRYRAIGERPMGTVPRLICENMPGRVMLLNEAKRLDDKPEKDAWATMDELEGIANHAVAEYNVNPHDGIGGRQPALLFEIDANRRGIDNFADLDSFRLDTMAIHVDAQLSPSGIRAFGCLRYHHVARVPDLLSDLRPSECRRKRRDDATATVDFRYDPMDISRIYVWNRVRRTYVELVCDDEDYADGMPLYLHEMIRDFATAQKLAFNTSAERALARSRRIQAIRKVRPKDEAKERNAVAKLYEIPRLRQITGNIVHLHTERSTVTVGEFISHDRVALTSLDSEILSPRPQIGGRRHGPASDRQDRRDAGSESSHQDGTAAPPVRRRRGASLMGDDQ